MARTFKGDKVRFMLDDVVAIGNPALEALLVLTKGFKCEFLGTHETDCPESDLYGTRFCVAGVDPSKLYYTPAGFYGDPRCGRDAPWVAYSVHVVDYDLPGLPYDPQNSDAFVLRIDQQSSDDEAPSFTSYFLCTLAA